MLARSIDEFEERYGTPAYVEAMERISDAHWNRGGLGVTFLDIQQHNACNHTLSGTILIGDEVYGFIVDSGDWGGTVVRAWGDPEEVGVAEPPPKPAMFTFVPKDDYLQERNPGLYQVYIHWTKQPWFQEKVRGYNYDRHFAPGCATEKHYRDWADSKGMKIRLVRDD